MATSAVVFAEGFRVLRVYLHEGDVCRCMCGRCVSFSNVRTAPGFPPMPRIGGKPLAGEALLYLSNTSVILVDEPGVDKVDNGRLKDVYKDGEALAAAGRLPVLDLRDDRKNGEPFLADAALMARISMMGRNGLVICGGLLEGAVTQISLAALMDGLDVFLAVDLVVSDEPDKVSLFLSRISACGGHTLSYRQIVLELLSAERHPAKRAPLEALLI